MHDFGIATIPGNRGNGQFDGHWLALVMKHVGMSKLGWLNQNRHVASNSRMILTVGGSLYMLGSVTSEGIPLSKPFHASAARVFQSLLPRLETHHAPGTGSQLDAFPNRPTTSTIPRHAQDSRAVCKIHTIRIRHVRLIRLPNLVRGGRPTKESQLDPFVPGQIK
ncbi:hypothetical protein TNCV_1116431 [Trichonephila clavipes]|nr:hypothetical protein TNCV_1116431 [Trichonephila clavipes]